MAWSMFRQVHRLINRPLGIENSEKKSIGWKSLLWVVARERRLLLWVLAS